MNQISELIFKRNRCLNSNIDPAGSIRPEIMDRYISSKTLTESIAVDYIRQFFGKNKLSDGYERLIKILEYFDNNSKLVNEFKTAILYNENVDFLSEVIESSDIKDKEAICEYISNIKYVDRIISNDLTLFEKIADNIGESDLNSILKANSDSISIMAEVLDMFNIKDYQKMNLMIDEYVYLSAKNGKDLDDSLLEAITKYYIINTNEDINKYKRVLEENLSVSKDSKVFTLFEANDSDEEIDSINQLITHFTFTFDETPDAGNVTESIFANTTITDIEANIDKFLLYLASIYNYDRKGKITDCIAGIYKGFIRNKFYKTDCTRDDIVNLKNIVTATCTKINNEDLVSRIKNVLIDLFVEDEEIFYSKENLNVINTINSCTDTVALDEFKLFKSHSIFKALRNLDKFLQGKEKVFLKKAKKKFVSVKDKITNILFGEMSEMKDNIYSFIGEDNKMDICVRQYSLDEFESISTANEELTKVIKEFNQNLDLDNMSYIRVYYIMSEDFAEVHIKDSRVIELSEADKELVNSSLSVESTKYLDIIDNCNTVCKESNLNNTLNTIIDSIYKIKESGNFTDEHFKLALECMNYIEDKDFYREALVSAYSDSKFSKVISEGTRVDIESFENSILEEANEINKTYTDIPYEISLEAYSLLFKLFEDAGVIPYNEASMADDWDDEDEDEEEDTEENDKKSEEKPKDNKKENKDSGKESGNNKGKKPSEILGDGEDLPKDDYKHKTSLNLSGIALALKGLAGKFKDFNTKQKEVCKNLDHAITSTIKGIKDTISNDKREQIIKGSVIPSFSNCIKFGVALVGLGIATGGVVAPVIAAIGAIAMDKKLTKKERLLLLDEIETEIEVIDKELAIADSNNQLNKYRALLKYKKDLQRQYQRIRYNVRVGSDGSMFASSNAGMSHSND